MFVKFKILKIELIYRKSGQKAIEYISLRDQRASEHLQKVRNEAKINGSDNFEIMRLKLMNNRNNPKGNQLMYYFLEYSCRSTTVFYFISLVLQLN